MTFLKKLARYYYLKLLRLKDNPHKIALGLAVGVLIGFLPTWPLQTVLAVGLAMALRGSKLTAAAGVWISPAPALPAFYYADFVVGRWLLGWHVKFKPLDYSIFTLLGEAQRTLKVMCVGGLLMGLPAAVLTYLITYQIIDLARKRRMARRLKRESQPPSPSTAS